MTKKSEIRDFLVSRRANVTPQNVGLPDRGEERRVPGLRREEVAMLANVSTDYYTRLERGALPGASDAVLNAIAQALQLSDVERAHLFDLARDPSSHLEHRGAEGERAVRPSVQRVLNHMIAPAIVYNAHQDLVASNLLGWALHLPHFEADRPNMARFIFLDSRAPDFYEDWPLACSLTAAMLRYEAGRDPLNPDLTALIGELSTRSPQFRRNWAERDVHEHRTGRKLYRHPIVGDLELTYDVFEIPGEAGLFITTYTAVEDDSPTTDNLALLASWAATRAPQDEAGLD
jgi:transcriptional regulator with XRE-family HTH domain